MIITLCHGFNLAPEKMLHLGSALKNSFSATNLTIHNVILCNHDTQIPQKNISWKIWAKDIVEQSASNNPEPHYFIGHSLGGLAGLMAQHLYGITFSKQIFMATPFYFRRPWQAIPRWYNFLSSQHVNPYLHQKYRARSIMNWYNYKNVFLMQYAFHRAHHLKSPFMNTPTLCINDPNDEIVDVAKVEQWVQMLKSNHLPWQFQSIHSQPMHHVFIDPFSVGEDQWEIFIESIHSFLTA